MNRQEAPAARGCQRRQTAEEAQRAAPALAEMVEVNKESVAAEKVRATKAAVEAPRAAANLLVLALARARPSERQRKEGAWQREVRDASWQETIAA